jgi:hypothetical protein
MNAILKQLNPTNETLTAEKLRILIGKELTDEAANETILAIKKLVSIILDYQYENELKQQKITEPNLKQIA